MAGPTCSPSFKREHIRQTAEPVFELLTVFLRGAEVNTDYTRLLSDLGIENLAQGILFELLDHLVNFLDRLLKVSSELNTHNVIATITRITAGRVDAGIMLIQIVIR